MNKGYEKNTPQKQLDFLQKMNNSDNDCVLGIFNNKNNQHIGTTAIHNIIKDNNIKKAEFGIIIGEKLFWNKGIGQEAWKMMIEYGFNEFNLDFIETAIFVKNKSSLKIAEKVGFRYSELRKNNLVKDGKKIDVVVLRMQRDHLKNIK